MDKEELEFSVSINPKPVIRFVMEVFEIAFGDDAMEKDYSYDDVINQLVEFSNHAFKYEEQEGLI